MEPKAPHANCDVCPLQGEPIVFGHGPERADIVVVGEAPGAQEVNGGIPFSGRSGQLLNKILQHKGIERKDVYVTNAVLCRPPGNRTPKPPEVRACHDRLVAEIRSRDPKTVLALGNTAAHTVLNTKTAISQLRVGAAGKQSPYLEAQVIPTFHPAAILRQPDLLPSIIRDVGKVGTVVAWEPTKYKVIENIYTALNTLTELAKHPLLALDVENVVPDMKRLDAKNVNWLCIGISHRPGAAVVFAKNVCEDPRFVNQLNDMFLNPNIKWLMQNGKYDIQILWGGGVSNARVDEDTMLMHYSCDERKGTHGLETLATEYLGAPMYKTAFYEKGGFSGSLADLYHYNAQDVDVTHRLFAPLRKEQQEDGVVDMYYKLLIPGSNALARAEYRGIRIDRDYINRLAVEYQSQLEGKELELVEWVNNPRSPKQVKEALAELGLPVMSTAKEILREIDHDFARKLLGYRGAHKLWSTYIKGMRAHDVRGRIHPTFLLHGTETGRLSCRRPNLQNIPSGSTIRNIFKASAGKVLLAADYSQIEFRLAAIFAGDERWKEEFRQGRSFHKERARKFYGETWTDLQYLRAKAVNFGILYGRQAASLVAEHKMDFREAQGLIDNFFNSYPKVKVYQRDLERQIRENGYLTSYFGRKRRFWYVTRDNWHEVSKEGYNFPLQSTASDLTLLSLIRIEPEIRDVATPVVTVHDSLMFEVEESQVREVALYLKKEMEDTGFDVPTPIDLKVGLRWGELKEYHV